MNAIWRIIVILCCVFWTPSYRWGGAVETVPEYRTLAANAVSVPQTLLSLIHTPQVQSELNITGAAMDEFLPFLRQLDGPWWTARIRPLQDQRAITAKQEQLLVAEVENRFGPSALRRLRQLELQAQGPRMLARPDVSEFLQLTRDQADQLAKLFAATDALAAKLKTAEGQKDAKLMTERQQAAGGESERARKILNPEQQSRLQTSMGSLVDTSKLERIYPLAPELIDSGDWVGADRVRLNDLMGHVVLVHFYAFQCSNCRANFQHYNRWHRTLTEKGVRVVGIQTPETSAERDALTVRNAAIRDGFEFPILIDLKSDNWNAWANTMWPTVYVIDQQGYVRFWWQGELNWQGATGDQAIEKLIDRLLAESHTDKPPGPVGPPVCP